MASDQPSNDLTYDHVQFTQALLKKVAARKRRQLKKNSILKRKQMMRKIAHESLRKSDRNNHPSSCDATAAELKLSSPENFSGHNCSNTTRKRTSSCDELKNELIKKSNGLENESMSDMLSLSWVEDNESDDHDGESSADNAPGDKHSENGKVFTAIGALTDFERFVVENADVDFEEHCYPKLKGEECTLCQQNGNTTSIASSFCLHSELQSKDNIVSDNVPEINLANTKQTHNIGGQMTCITKNKDSPILKSALEIEQIVSDKIGLTYPNYTNALKMDTSSVESDSCQQSVGLLGKRKLSPEGQTPPIIQSCKKIKGEPETDGFEDNIRPVSTEVQMGNSGTLFEMESDIDSLKRKHSISQLLSIPTWMYVALDCEMVGTGPKGRRSVLARCSIVDYQGHILYDKFVQPEEPITDYRTRWSGVLPKHMKDAEPTAKALQDIHQILENKIVVGHSVYNDFNVLRKTPPYYMVRDTAQCKKLVAMAGIEGQGNGLKKLTSALLGRQIQTKKSGHCSVEDARSSLDLFKLVRREYEAELYAKWAGNNKKKDVMSELAAFVERACAQVPHQRKRQDSAGESQFLKDEYWPQDIIE